MLIRAEYIYKYSVAFICMVQVRTTLQTRYRVSYTMGIAFRYFEEHFKTFVSYFFDKDKYYW